MPNASKYTQYDTFWRLSTNSESINLSPRKRKHQSQIQEDRASSQRLRPDLVCETNKSQEEILSQPLSKLTFYERQLRQDLLKKHREEQSIVQESELHNP